MRVCLVDNPRSRDWADARNRFRALEHCLTKAGHEVAFCDAPTSGRRTYLAGSGRESDVLPLLESARIVETVKAANADLTIFPLRGGLAHGSLMARACGEFPADRRIALWCDAPTRTLFLDADAAQESLSPLVADALERASLELADALVLPHAGRLEEIRALGVELPPTVLSAEPGASSETIIGETEAIQRLVFIGALRRSTGAVAFIDAIERLDADGVLAGREIVFAGPIENLPFAPGKEWLGLRAARWRFPFSVVETRNLAQALEQAFRSGDLAIVAAHDFEDFPSSVDERQILCIQLGAAPTNDLGATIARLIKVRLSGAQSGAPQPRLGSGWSRIVETLDVLPLRGGTRQETGVSLSICTVHYERAGLLEIAIGSIAPETLGSDTEIIVVDNGSQSAESHATLDRLGRMENVRVVKLSEPLPYPVAYNHAASLAKKDYLVFLDDDNAFVHDGLKRLRRACAMQRFDVIVSNLEVFDEISGESSESAGTLAFIGPARSAGLFFNAFGDTCLAINREVFHRLGGFRDSVAAYPTADWVMLARAQAAGLKIGVLQEPAYRYRRDLRQSGVNWQKFDQHGTRSLVLQAYGAAFDPLMIAKFSQGQRLASMP